jgi:hypothetical protein
VFSCNGPMLLAVTLKWIELLLSATALKRLCLNVHNSTYFI